MVLFVLSLCPFDISVVVGAFVIGLSQISSFFSFDWHCLSVDLSTSVLNKVVQVAAKFVEWHLHVHTKKNEYDSTWSINK